MMKDKLIRAFALMLTCWIVEGAGAVGAYEVDTGLTGVTVRGRVTLVGSVPKTEQVTVHRDSKFCGETMPIEAVQVDPGLRAIRGVVVSLKGVTKGKALVPEDVRIVFENRTCRFIPRTNAAVVGSVLEIVNKDPIMHNTHIRRETRFGSTVINVAQPVGAPTIEKTLKDVGVMDVRCDAHTFMRASVHVFEHPYFAVTDETGRFELTGVPPGTYRLRFWHELFGTQEQGLTVPGSGKVSVDLELEGQP